MKESFTVNSTETIHENVLHGCTFIKAIFKEGDFPKILVFLGTPIPKYFYKSLNEDLEFLVLAPRLQGSSVYPEISKPCYVYMCVPKKGGNWENGPWDILDWGEIKMCKKGGHESPEQTAG